MNSVLKLATVFEKLAQRSAAGKRLSEQTIKEMPTIIDIFFNDLGDIEIILDDIIIEKIYNRLLSHMNWDLENASVLFGIGSENISDINKLFDALNQLDYNWFFKFDDLDVSGSLEEMREILISYLSDSETNNEL